VDSEATRIAYPPNRIHFAIDVRPLVGLVEMGHRPGPKRSGQTCPIPVSPHRLRLIPAGLKIASFNSFLVAQGEPRVTAGPWANPYAVGRDGDRDEVIAKYADGKSELQSRAPELQGKALGCWCAPEPCHGDILKQWADSGWPR
jgi:hypothetical protein